MIFLLATENGLDSDFLSVDLRTAAAWRSLSGMLNEKCMTGSGNYSNPTSERDSEKMK